MRETAYLTGARQAFRLRSRIVAIQGLGEEDELEKLVDALIAELKRTRDDRDRAIDEWTAELKENDRLKAENTKLRNEQR